MQVLDELGRTLVLRELGSGGEGTVYRVENRVGEVAKVWSASMSLPRRTEKIAKLRQMTRMRNAEVDAICTWPRNLVLHGGQVIGYTMDALPGGSISLEHLLLPKHRIKKGNPWNSVAYLSRAALRFAQAIQSLNNKGVLFADFNPSNAYFAATGEVRLIDCDGYEFTFNGVRFANHAVRADCLAPELIGLPSETVKRTEQHEAFGLAVTLFKMFYQGTSPYYGFDDQGKCLDDFGAAKQGRFIFTSPDRDHDVPPPDTVSPDVFALFRRAFDRKAIRPTAVEWVDALRTQIARQQQCAAHEGHEFDKSLRRCPWCSHAAAIRFDYFGEPRPRRAATLPNPIAARPNTPQSLGGTVRPGIPRDLPTQNPNATSMPRPRPVVARTFHAPLHVAPVIKPVPQPDLRNSLWFDLGPKLVGVLAVALAIGAFGALLI